MCPLRFALFRQYPHCVSSRYVLSHYYHCKDETCQICGPVRNTVRSTRASGMPVGGAVPNPNAQNPPMAYPQMTAQVGRRLSR